MGLEPEFLDLASTTVTVFPLTTVNSYGHPVHSTAGQTYPARVEYTPRLVVTSQGRQVTASATVYLLSTTATVDVQDKVTLPRDTAAKLVHVAYEDDEEGQHHLELSFGS